MTRVHNNQNGYSLILVLLIITVIGIMSIPILSSIMNSNDQFKKSEEKQQLTSLTDMGELYIQNAVQTATANAKNSVMTWLQSSPNPFPTTDLITSRYLSELQTQMNTFAPSSGKIILLKDNSFQYKISSTIDSNNKIVNYTITPSLNGVYDLGNSVKGYISINLNITTGS